MKITIPPKTQEPHQKVAQGVKALVLDSGPQIVTGKLSSAHVEIHDENLKYRIG